MTDFGPIWNVDTDFNKMMLLAALLDIFNGVSQLDAISWYACSASDQALPFLSSPSQVVRSPRSPVLVFSFFLPPAGHPLQRLKAADVSVIGVSLPSWAFHWRHRC